DVADEAAMVRVREEIRRTHGPLHGIFHCAGLIRDKLFYLKPPEDFEAVLRPKVQGTRVLDRVFCDPSAGAPDFVVLFSSITAVRGNPGQSDYAFANAFMDAFADARREAAVRILSIAWPLWRDGGMTLTDEELEAWRAHTGSEPMAEEDGLLALAGALAGPDHRVLPVPGRRQALEAALGISTSRSPEKLRAPLPETPLKHSDETTAPTSATGGESPEALLKATLAWLESVVSTALKLPGGRLDAQEGFVEYGVDSIVALRVIKDLEDEVGALRKTLLFENSNLEELAECFVREHEEEMRRITGLAAEAEPVPAEPEPFQPRPTPTAVGPSEEPSPSPAPETSLPLLVRQWGPGRAELDDLFDRMQQGTRSEFSVSLGTPGIAPFAFIGSSRRGYFNVNYDKRSLMAYAYTGEDGAFEETAGELAAHCDEQGLALNILTESRLERIGDRPMTATPFGAMQRLPSLSEFALEGRAMRRLRYMVSHFAKQGEARTVEFHCGSDPATALAVAGRIDAWVQMKETANPFILDVKTLILGGTLPRRYRVFLTYLDDRLENAVL
ncbi:MAG: KR domain-containing protein, partial [Acidobacteria bacterium]|nr:KR domain-containing protein [Acidobacteriota bacterium]